MHLKSSIVMLQSNKVKAFAQKVERLFEFHCLQISDTVLDFKTCKQKRQDRNRAIGTMQTPPPTHTHPLSMRTVCMVQAGVSYHTEKYTCILETNTNIPR